MPVTRRTPERDDVVTAPVLIFEREMVPSVGDQEIGEEARGVRHPHTKSMPSRSEHVEDVGLNLTHPPSQPCLLEQCGNPAGAFEVIQPDVAQVRSSSLPASTSRVRRPAVGGFLVINSPVGEFLVSLRGCGLGGGLRLWGCGSASPVQEPDEGAAEAIQPQLVGIEYP